MKPTKMYETDAVEVSELLRASYTVLGEREDLSPQQTHFLISERGSLECVRRESRSERYYVVRDAGGIVGVVSVSGDRITKLYVRPDRTGEGIGRLLFEAAESVVRAEGHTRVTLGAFPMAVPFYERMGMSVVGHKTGTGVLEGITWALMEKELAGRMA
jgi:GNAT superfamily N-acetyltransferase